MNIIKIINNIFNKKDMKTIIYKKIKFITLKYFNLF